MQTFKFFKQSRAIRRFHGFFGALVIGCSAVLPLTLVAPASAQTSAADYDIDGQFRTARKMYEKGDLQGAELIFKKILSIQPSHTASRDYLARIKDRRENVPQITLANHLAAVKIKEVKLENVSFSDAVKYLRSKVPEVLAENGKEDINVNFIVFNSGGEADKLIPTDLHLTNIPVSELIRYLCDLGGYTATFRGEMVEFRPEKD